VGGGLDEIGQQPHRGPEPARVRGGALGRVQGFVVAAQAVEADRVAPVGGNEPEPLAATQRALAARLGKRQRFGLLSAPVRHGNGGAQGQLAARRLHHGLRFGDQRDRRRHPAAEQIGGDAVVDGDR
jgi:hypothetical protein